MLRAGRLRSGMLVTARLGSLGAPGGEMPNSAQRGLGPKSPPTPDGFMRGSCAVDARMELLKLVKFTLAGGGSGAKGGMREVVHTILCELALRVASTIEDPTP